MRVDRWREGCDQTAFVRAQKNRLRLREIPVFDSDLSAETWKKRDKKNKRQLFITIITVINYYYP